MDYVFKIGPLAYTAVYSCFSESHKFMRNKLYFKRCSSIPNEYEGGYRRGVDRGD